MEDLGADAPRGRGPERLTLAFSRASRFEPTRRRVERLNAVLPSNPLVSGALSRAVVRLPRAHLRVPWSSCPSESPRFDAHTAQSFGDHGSDSSFSRRIVALCCARARARPPGPTNARGRLGRLSLRGSVVQMLLSSALFLRTGANSSWTNTR